MNQIELKTAVIKIQSSDFKESDKKKGLNELIKVYSERTNLNLALAKQEVESLYNKLSN